MIMESWNPQTCQKCEWYRRQGQQRFGSEDSGENFSQFLAIFAVIGHLARR